MTNKTILAKGYLNNAMVSINKKLPSKNTTGGLLNFKKLILLDS